MLSESLEVFRQHNFNYDRQVESFLRHSAAYVRSTSTARTTSPVIPYQEV
jgi:hypothetical protein